MLIIADNKIPKIAKDKLASIGDLCLLSTSDIVYEAISGHPDIFIFQHKESVIIAPQTPKYIIDKLLDHNVSFEFGDNNLGMKHPQTTYYNTAYGDGLLIGNKQTTDTKIVELTKTDIWIQSPQSYARCNTLILDHKHIITSEITVYKAIPDSLFVNPNQIKLEMFPNGFIGGCVGILDHRLYILGSLDYHPQKIEIQDYCIEAGFTIVELYNGPLIDGGGIFFL